MTLIICAIRAEVKPFLKVLENGRVEKYAAGIAYIGTVKDAPVIIVRCGVGLKRAVTVTQLILESYSINRVIFSGVAGGADRILKIGDTVVSDEILFHETDVNLLNNIGVSDTCSYKADDMMLSQIKEAVDNNQINHRVYFGKITSGNKFVTGKNFKVIFDKFRPLCLDMETAAVAHVCSKKNIPFIAIRSISDTVEKSGLFTFFKNVTFASENSFSVANVLLSME